MVLYLVRRVLAAIGILLLISLFTYVIFFVLSPDPAVQICGKTCTPERIDQIRGDAQGRTYRYARDVPEYHLTKEGTPFTLLGVHFKAKVVTGTDAEIADDNDKRLAEARGARAIADSLLADEANGEVILLGDFNDDTESPSTQAVKGTDPEFGHAAGDRPETERWTVQYAGSKMTYDDQWSSPGLSSRRQADSVTILRVAVSDHAAVAATYTLE